MYFGDFVAYEKLSKREQKKLNAVKRKGWGKVIPISKIIPSKKKMRKEYKDDCYSD